MQLATEPDAYLPGAHAVQLVAPVAENEPEAQLRQLGENVPKLE